MFSETASEDDSFFEYPNDTLVSVCTDNDEELVCSEFKDYTGNLPLITTPIVIEVGTQFISMLVAVHYVEQYAFQNHFSVYKYKCEIFADSTCRKRVLKCDIRGRYNERLSRPTLGKQTNKGAKSKDVHGKLI
ncbi:30922_t:CDS:2 [Gigaspora margarita]|uniref:30922_t:CDS:1 n=1 Tax=Gigaspora margarita TaxID=4874 RepID=A0ABN7VWS9_GIGMA|nr:30922_t:CDS:2 [Gigaspora margarita]